MKLSEFLDKINLIAPFDLAEDWDNIGLMTGDLNCDIRKVGITLDPVSEAVIAAAENNCQVLLCHHPLIFRALKKLDLNRDPGRAVKEAVKRDVNILAAHTNWDCVTGGVNTELAKLINLDEISPLDVNSGLGAKGFLKEDLGLKGFMDLVKKAWNLTHIDFYFNKNLDLENLKIKRVALCGGSGAEFWSLARDFNADIYLTADMKYHELIDANRAGLNIALIDHGEMERASLPEFMRKLKELCAGLEFILLDVKALNERIVF